MNDQRQQAFLKLKAPCVELSTVALKFRTKSCPVKDVLIALERVKATLTILATNKQLDPKLAEYAFFPLAQQVFNETKQLSPRCLEVATECVTLLVQYGYGRAIQPSLAKQLLILLSMLAGSGPQNSIATSTDQLKVAALDCMRVILEVSTGSHADALIKQDMRGVVDQIVYLVLELMTNCPSPEVQTYSTRLLSQMMDKIPDRVFMASLLPRTASTLIKVLRPTTKIRRSQQNTASHIGILTKMLSTTVSDRLETSQIPRAESEALDESWRKATAGQVHNVLVQVCQFRTHDSPQIRRALEDLCVMIIESCYVTLAQSLPVILESLIILAAQPDADSTRAMCQYLLTANPALSNMLKTSIDGWKSSLTRQLQGQDASQRVLAVQRLSTALTLLEYFDETGNYHNTQLLSSLVNGLDVLIVDNPLKAQDLEVYDSQNLLTTISKAAQLKQKQTFPPIILNHQSFKQTTAAVQQLLRVLSKNNDGDLPDTIISMVKEFEGPAKLVAIWLGLQIMSADSSVNEELSLFVTDDSVSHTAIKRNSMLGELFAATFSALTRPDKSSESQITWQIQALAVEVMVMYAESFPEADYRPELMDTLYPVISLMTSSNTLLQRHAFIALDRLAIACQYQSSKALVVDNADYLVNSIAWKLNTYSLSPEAPQILRMMILLCGAELIPYLDDLISSIFAALDSYHGYPEWVQLLFQSLAAVVDVSVKEPQLALTSGTTPVVHLKNSLLVTKAADICGDLTSRSKRKEEQQRDVPRTTKHPPRRPWTDESTSTNPTQIVDEAGDLLKEQSESPTASKSVEDEELKLSKSHQLLLDIAQASIPHLASPSSQVRQLLLNIFKDISPLLGHDESTFLPLVNAAWPSLVARLSAEENGVDEVAYNIATAAESIAMLCRSAGDFMSSRLEKILPQLTKIFNRQAMEIRKSSEQNKKFITATSSKQKEIAKSSNVPTVLQAVSSHNQGWRTSQGQILAAMIDLFQTVLSHVHLSIDSGEAIVGLLLPFMSTRTGVREALLAYNADAVWLFDVQPMDGHASPAPNAFQDHMHWPELRKDLQDSGFFLIAELAK